MELLTAAQMRAIEAAAIESGKVTGLELMERAGRGVVEAIWEEWPELRAVSGRAVVLCGPGNNGGDGFVVARMLKEWGWEVEVFLYGNPAKLPPDARVNYERWAEMGAVESLRDDTEIELAEADFVIDAIFGAGLSRGFDVPVTLNYAYHMYMADGFWCDGQVRKPYFVSIDVVSEVDLDSGRAIAANVDHGGEMGAHLTVTFHRPKVGHYLGECIGITGRLAVVDIGLPNELDPNDFNPTLRRRDLVGLIEAPKYSVFQKNLTKAVFYPDLDGQHKYTHGHALCLSGGIARGGAARLAARGALRIGAGVVTVGCPPSALMENAQALDAVMVRRAGDGVALAAMLEEDGRINALCLGPGMGTGAREAGLLRAGIDGMKSHPTGGVCLDADALTVLAEDAALFARLHERCVLTPHAGEFARLFPDIAEKLAAPATSGPAYSKVDATREAAARAGCVVLFKGADTVIADPTGRCSINAAVYERAAPWLATAGSGDVLAGFITGLMARGFSPMQAAETGAWLHVECARSFGPGLIAEDLPEELPKVFRSLGV